MMFFKKSLTLFVLMISFTQVVLSAPDSGPFAHRGAGEISSISKRQIQDLSDRAGTINYDHPPVKRQIQERSDGYGKGTLHLNLHPSGKRLIQDIRDGAGNAMGHAHGKRGHHNDIDGAGTGRGQAHGKREIQASSDGEDEH